MLVASKHSPALFPCQAQNRPFEEGRLRPFHTGSVRLWLPCGRRKNFLPYIYYPVNQR